MRAETRSSLIAKLDCGAAVLVALFIYARGQSIMLIDLLTPDDFAGDAYGWLTNQAAHFVLGGAMQLLVGFWWIPAYLGVELVHYAAGGTIQDGITDLAFVGCGAAVAYALRLDQDAAAVTAFSLFITALVLGVLA